MSCIRLLVASAATCLLHVMPAAAQTAGSSVFAQQPLSERELAESYGGRTSSVGGVRALVDPEALDYLQQVGRTSSIAMDNWWAQTGAALIAENLLARTGT